MKLFLGLFLTLLSCKINAQKYFPDYKEIISAEFPVTDNIYPIATLDLSKKGINEKIHITYVYFNYNSDSTQFLRKGDNPSNYSFQLLNTGLMIPLFTSKSLSIDDSDVKYFNKSRRVFDSAKQTLNLALHINYPKEPEWWQSDETPKNKKGKKFKFICQIDMYAISKDDCRMFIFYDKDDKIIKNICQWD